MHRPRRPLRYGIVDVDHHDIKSLEDKLGKLNMGLYHVVQLSIENAKWLADHAADVSSEDALARFIALDSEISEHLASLSNSIVLKCRRIIYRASPLEGRKDDV